MITRTFGKLFRGTATPFQLMSACILGSILGFMPGFVQAPGLILLVVLLLILLNANLLLGALIGALAKLLALLLAPVSFAVGRFLLDGPTQGLFKKLINTPVLALFGFDYYLTTGGLALGLVVGLLAGVIFVKLVDGFRRKMIELEEGSERYKTYASKGWVKVLVFIFIGGGKGKKTYQELLDTRMGNPVRPLGVVFAVLLGVVLVVLRMFAAGPIVTAALQNGLERANGATVDLEEATLDLKENRLTIKGLAMADPNNLGTDLFRASQVTADVSGMRLLKKQLQLDRVQISEGSSGENRTSPGKRVGPEPEPPAADKSPDVKTIDDYIRNAKEWKERLAQIRRWMEKLSGPKEEKDGPAREEDETLQERLEREIREKGYARVRASHLVDGAPTLTISELMAEKVRLAKLPNETVDITGRNLSTHPALLGKPPEVIIKSSGDTLGFRALVGGLGSDTNRNVLSFHYRGLPTDAVAGNLKIGGSAPLQGGTIDLAADGDWQTAAGVSINMPLKVTLHNTTLALPGTGPTKVENFVLPVGLKGPIDNPRISVDQKVLASSLAQAGISRVKEELKDKAQQKIGEQIGTKLPEAKGVLKGILGGKGEEKK